MGVTPLDHEPTASRYHSSRSHPAAWTDIPHLRNVFRPSRSSKSDVTDIEYTENWQERLNTDQRQLDHIYERDAYQSFIEGLKAPKDERCAARLLLVEDISSVLIQNLLEIFDITPEMFEEHLQGADWADRTEKTEVCNSHRGHVGS